MLTGRVHRIATPQEMNDFASRFVDGLLPGTVLLLYGELGGGKTTFVQGLASYLGVAEQVTSPTFTIVGEYAIANHLVFKTLVHADLYRLSPEEAQKDPMVQEMLQKASDPQRLTVIEWADRLGDITPKPAWRLVFNHGTSEGQRIIDAVQIGQEGTPAV